MGPHADLKMACFRFQAKVTTKAMLPIYKGSTFHGGFSRALARVGPRFRDFFFTPVSPGKHAPSSAIPKPFMLIPPLEEKTLYQAGDHLEWGLILYGEAISHFMIAFAAMENLGQIMGLGRSQGKYKISQVDFLGINGARPVFVDERWLPMPEPMCAGEILSLFQNAEVDTLALHLITRLRLKENNALVRTHPSFPVFMDRLLGRIHSLARFYGNGPLMDREERDRMGVLSAGIRLQREQSTAHWSEWERPSKSGRGEMSFGGLVGTLAYTGNLAPFLPWLNLGQWTGVGGKTSFGLGLYEMEIKGGWDDGLNTAGLW